MDLVNDVMRTSRVDEGILDGGLAAASSGHALDLESQSCHPE
jgi:hypothetical protein